MSQKTSFPKATSRLSLYANSFCLCLKYQFSIEKISVFTEMLQARNTDQLPKLISTYTKSTSKKIEACQRDHKNFLQSVKSNNFRKWLNKGGFEQKIARRVADRLINAEIQWERVVIQFSEEKSKLLFQKKIPQ